MDVDGNVTEKMQTLPEFPGVLGVYMTVEYKGILYQLNNVYMGSRIDYPIDVDRINVKRVYFEEES